MLADFLRLLGVSLKNDGSADELNASDELSKIKGDAIGDTLYSERWVLRVLIKLSNLSEETWSTELEEEICALWDMTAEKDVVLFLLSNDFYSLFSKVIRVINTARCIEILVGILGNMCCVESSRNALADHDASITVVNLITSEDSLVLVQVVRLLNSCLWNLRMEVPECPTRPNSPSQASPGMGGARGAENVTGLVNVVESCAPWLSVIESHKELLLRHLGFFLSSAINEDLLCSSLELLDTLLAIPSLDLSSSASSDPDLASGLAECLRQLLRGARVGDSITANRRLWRALQVWIGLVGLVASCQQGRINLGAAGDVLTKCFTKLVMLLTTPEALKTQEPEMATLCLCVLETLPQIRVSATVLARLVKVLYSLDQDMEMLVQESEESLEVVNLLHRAVQFIKLRIEECDDVVLLLQNLTSSHQGYLLSIASQDVSLKRKLEHGLLQIKTNGLVQ